MKNVTKIFACTLSLCALIGLANCGSSPAKKPSEKKETSMKSEIVTLPSGLSYKKVKAVDQGAAPQRGQQVKVHYTGRLITGKNADGSPVLGNKFDSSVDRGEPFVFPLGMGYVIKGWDEGVARMKVGEKFELYIPSNLGYGSRGAGRAIPPNADLYFEVELLGIQ